MKDTQRMLSIRLSETCKLHMPILKRKKTRPRGTGLLAHGRSASGREQDLNSCPAVFHALISTKPRSYGIKDKKSGTYVFILLPKYPT